MWVDMPLSRLTNHLPCSVISKFIHLLGDWFNLPAHCVYIAVLERIVGRHCENPFTSRMTVWVGWSQALIWDGQKNRERKPVGRTYWKSFWTRRKSRQVSRGGLREAGGLTSSQEDLQCGGWTGWRENLWWWSSFSSHEELNDLDRR